MVDDKIREFRSLQEELNEHRSNLGMLMAQRNENEMVKQVRVRRLCPISYILPSSMVGRRHSSRLAAAPQIPYPFDLRLHLPTNTVFSLSMYRSWTFATKKRLPDRIQLYTSKLAQC